MRALALDQRRIELLAASAPAGWPRRCASRAACRAPRARPCRRRSRARPARRSCRGPARPHCGRRRRRRPRSTSSSAARRSDWFSPIVAMLRGQLLLDGAAARPAGAPSAPRRRCRCRARSPRRCGRNPGTARSWRRSRSRELTSTTAPLLPSTATPTRPSAAVRPAFLAAAARPLVRSQSIAASMSPLGLAERLLAIHHAGAGALAQFLHSRGRDLSHVSYPLELRTRSWAAGRSRRLGPGRRRDKQLRLRPAPASAGGSSIAPMILAARGRAALLAGEHRLGDRVAIEADGAAGVVIAGDREGDALRADVRIEDRDDRDAEHIGFLDRQLFLVGVDHEHHVGNAAHVADAAER